MLNKLIDFENNSRVLDFKFSYKDILIWPYIRSMFFNKIYENKNGLVQLRKGNYKDKFYRDYVKYNSFNLPHKDILFIWSSVTLVETENIVYDRLIDNFIKAVPNDTAEMIGYYHEFNTSKLEKNNVIFSRDRFIKKIISYEGEKNTISNDDINRIDDLVEYLKKNLPFEIEDGIFEAVRQKARTIIREFPAYYKYYGKLADIVQPRLVIFHSAVIGKPEIRVINDLGITTAEYQHGCMDRNISYMHAENVAENMDYRKSVPKYFLSWGGYWIRNIHLPMDVYKIGNPMVQKNIEYFKKENQLENEFNILIVTTHLEPSIYVEIIDCILRKLSPKYNVIVKLHPRMTEKRKYYNAFEGNKRVRITHEGLIYDFFGICKYVIGDISTSLYEAAAVGKDVFIIDTDITREQVSMDFGIWIKDGQEFIKELSKGDKGKQKLSGADFFENDWKGNYSNFLNEIVYGK